MDRRGFVRIIEATIAVMLILGALIIVASSRPPRTSSDLSDTLSPYLVELAEDPVLRANITRDYDVNASISFGSNAQIISDLENYAGESINNQNLDLAIRVCSVDAPCYLTPWPEGVEEIFSEERFVGAVLEEPVFTPKKLKMFLWRK